MNARTDDGGSTHLRSYDLSGCWGGLYAKRATLTETAIYKMTGLPASGYT